MHQYTNDQGTSSPDNEAAQPHPAPRAAVIAIARPNKISRRKIVFSARKAAVVDSKPAQGAGPATNPLNEQVLVDALEALIRAKLTSNITLDGRLGDALGRIVSLVKDANRTQLQAVSDLGAQSCEAAINLGWLYHDFREVAQSTVSISSAVEEMAASIAELSNSSASSAGQSENARDTMRGCISDSRAAINAMGSIQQSSSAIGERVSVLQSAVDQIGEMANTIDRIARQTNLLALNATIEAARAGEAGRGFAVVAAEVKTLSVETGKATQEIRGRVDALTREMKEIDEAVKDSLKSVASGSEVVTQVGTIIESVGHEVAEVAQRIRGLSDVLSQQRAATTEITQNVLRISEKASKSKDEVEAIGGRLQGCEAIVQMAFGAAKEWPVDGLALTRFPADAASWKRHLSQILLGAEPAGAAPPPFAGIQALVEAEQLAKTNSALRGPVADLAQAITTAQQSGTTVVDEVRKQNWGGATPAYIACEEALRKASAAASKITG
jgi:methyl-accepting chemotaxis protein